MATEAHCFKRVFSLIDLEGRTSRRGQFAFLSNALSKSHQAAYSYSTDVHKGFPASSQQFVLRATLKVGNNVTHQALSHRLLPVTAEGTALSCWETALIGSIFIELKLDSRSPYLHKTCIP